MAEPKSKTVRIDIAILTAARDALAAFLEKNKDPDVALEITESFVIHYSLRKLIDIANCQLFPAKTVEQIVNAEKLKTAQQLLETLKKSGHCPEDLQIFDDPEKGLCLAAMLASEDRVPVPAEAVN